MTDFRPVTGNRNNSAADRSISLHCGTQYVRDSRYTANVQDQGVTSQGHGVTLRVSNKNVTS